MEYQISEAKCMDGAYLIGDLSKFVDLGWSLLERGLFEGDQLDNSWYPNILQVSHIRYQMYIEQSSEGLQKLEK